MVLSYKYTIFPREKIDYVDLLAHNLIDVTSQAVALLRALPCSLSKFVLHYYLLIFPYSFIYNALLLTIVRSASANLRIIF